MNILKFYERFPEEASCVLYFNRDYALGFVIDLQMHILGAKRGGKRKVSYARNVKENATTGSIPKTCFSARNTCFGLV